VPCKGGAKGFTCTLLARRSIAGAGEVTFYLTQAPEGTSLADLVRVAGAPWSIESLVEQAKGEVGLDQYKVRSWVGCHRHITLSMLAMAYLAVLRCSAEHHNAEQGAIGGCGPQNPRPGPAAAHSARSPAAAGRTRPRAAPAAARGPALVRMAPTPSATRRARALAPENIGICSATIWMRDALPHLSCGRMAVCCLT